MPALSEFLGLKTNNYAEYSGLLAVLHWAIEHHAQAASRVVSDSELMVNQMKGKYKVKSPGLRPLFEEARKLSRRLDKFEMRHTLRGGNKEADRLANEAMDRGMKKIVFPKVGKPDDFPPDGGIDSVRLDCDTRETRKDSRRSSRLPTLPTPATKACRWGPRFAPVAQDDRSLIMQLFWAKPISPKFSASTRLNSDRVDN